MAIMLAENNYGCSRIHLLRVSRQQGRHDIREIVLSIRLEGDFESAHIQGDNRKILPADTMKNTVHALARQHSIEPLENFGLHLIEHFLTYNAQITAVIIDGSERIWARLTLGAKPHPSAFTRTAGEERTVSLRGNRDGTHVRAGIANLLVLKTTGSAFKDFRKDPYTTLRDEVDGIFSTSIHADWLYSDEEAEFGQLWHGVRNMLLETFAEHDSQSSQHTLYAMGQAILDNFAGVREIHLALPSTNFYPADLKPLGMDNPGTVFLPIPEPYNTIDATLRKS
ncbi:MAG TPA: urate oxidase [Candidatus Acidoferrum sp.]|nr:urate oxidase [Candidatus Acidoferrum sp.]